MSKVKSPVVPVNPQATVTETRIQQKVIRDPKEVQFGLDGHLDYNKRRILVVRGHPDSAAVVSQVYARFPQQLDDTGKPFFFSKRLRGICHIDKAWNSPKRITGAEFLDYCDRWFTPTMLVVNSAGPGLILLDGGVPKLFGALCQQSRYSQIFGPMFSWAD